MSNLQSGFTTSSFEQFVRALSLLVFGPGVTVFGNGPDGGREATFNGKINYPYPPTQLWDGYGVIQAKFKEKFETTKADQDWALQQLKKELDLFKKSKKRKPKPEYYIFATNVDLTSASNGGIDKADDLLKKYYSTLGIKGHAVWDGNKIAGLLNIYPELRRSFIAYLTNGDLISELIKQLDVKTPNAEAILNSFIDRDMAEDEYARLEEAGDVSAASLHISKIFVDLPVSKELSSNAPDEPKNDQGVPLGGIVDYILKSGERQLDPRTLWDSRNSALKTTIKNRIVLFGGPGSGKSTVGQFVAQIHRAAILARRPQYTLKPEILNEIEKIKSICEEQGLSWPNTPRIPLRIDLNQFGKALSRKDVENVHSLEEYILKILKGPYRLDFEDLREWLGNFPWLLILDGLDEVPVTSNRADVMKCINAFIADAYSVNSNLFTIATTRVQGYLDEFLNDNTERLYILPLSETRGEMYINKYLAAMYPGFKENDKKKILSNMNECYRNDATKDLLLSPLQITFLITVIAAAGDIVKDRWKLLGSYYATIYRREQQKAVPPFNEILEDLKVHIDRLHQEVGFWLQFQGEVSSNFGAGIDTGELVSWLDRYLDEDGVGAEEKSKYIEKILKFTDHRLVFLTNKKDSEWSFEVRSLQEYMAAESLVYGKNPDLFESRIESIIPIPYWRNVLLFVVGKCFNDLQTRPFQDRIYITLMKLRSDSPKEYRLTGVLSMLAIELFESGAIKSNPRYQKLFADIAIELIEPHCFETSCVQIDENENWSFIHRLAQICNDSLKHIFKGTIERVISENETRSSLLAWDLLGSLSERGIGWAKDLADSMFPSDIDDQWMILRSQIESSVSSWYTDRLESCCRSLSPSRLGSLLPFGPRIHDDLGDGSAIVSLVSIMDESRCITQSINVLGSSGAKIEFVPIFENPNLYRIYDSVISGDLTDSAWVAYVRAKEFCIDPSPKSLSMLLLACANSIDSIVLRTMPWIIADCLDVCETADDLRRLAQLASLGCFGSAEDWRRAEGRWRASGITIEDLQYASKTDSPIDSGIGIAGAPLYSPSFSLSYQENVSIAMDLFSYSKDIPDFNRRCATFNWATHFHFLYAGRFSSVFPDRISPVLYDPMVFHGFSPSDLPRSVRNVSVGLPGELPIRDDWLRFLDDLGRSVPIVFPNLQDDWYAPLFTAFSQDKSRFGLLFFLLILKGSTITPLRSESDAIASHGINSTHRFLQIVNVVSDPDFVFRNPRLLAERTADSLKFLGDSQLRKRAIIFLFGKIQSLSTYGDYDQFLKDLYDSVSSLDEDIRSECVRLLGISIKHRLSNLHDNGALQKLGLPDAPIQRTLF